MLNNILSVKQLNLYVRSLIEGDPRLINVTVKGELSNFKHHYASGHWYFTLKDNDAAIRCVMFKGSASLVKFTPQDGLQVILRGRASLYEKDGQYQFYAEEMHADGIGDIALKFEQTKNRLAAEGLLDADSKRPLPQFPKKIAVITSPTGAAVRDIFNILGRRWPIAEAVLYPVAVQGELAVAQMLAALDKAYCDADADVIIIGRGGGSYEDLCAFNDEALARKLYESPVPVISAVGHETDFCICDFVADMRAPTPSAAAELAVPDKVEIAEKLRNLELILKKSLLSKYDLCRARLAYCEQSPYLKNPRQSIVNNNILELDRMQDKLILAAKSSLNSANVKIASYAAQLDALSPLKVLSRGFTAVTKDGKTVLSTNQLSIGDNVNLRFADSTAECTVNKILEE